TGKERTNAESTHSRGICTDGYSRTTTELGWPRPLWSSACCWVGLRYLPRDLRSRRHHLRRSTRHRQSNGQRANAKQGTRRPRRITDRRRGLRRNRRGPELRVQRIRGLSMVRLEDDPFTPELGCGFNDWVCYGQEGVARLIGQACKAMGNFIGDMIINAFRGAQASAGDWAIAGGHFWF